MDPIVVFLIKGILNMAIKHGAQAVKDAFDAAEKESIISLEDVEAKLITPADKQAALGG